MHLHGNCFSLRVILSEFYWRNKCKCAINTSLEGWVALTDSLTQWVAASRPPVCHLLHQSSISERAIKNKGRCYKPDFLWKQVKKKNNRAAVAGKPSRDPPNPHLHHCSQKVALVTANPEDRGLGLRLESCGYCGGGEWGGDGAEASVGFALARRGGVDVQLFLQWPGV